MRITCQFALFPLRTAHVGEVLEAALVEVEAARVELSVGRMCSEIQGEATDVFAALQSAFSRAAQMGEVVMTVTVSNTCE